MMRNRKSITTIALATAVVVQSVALAVPLAAAGPGDVVDRFQSAYRAGSVERMLDLYAADAIFEDVNQRHRAKGAEQLQALLAGIVGFHLSMGLTEDRRVVDGDTVVVEYAYEGQLNGAALGASVGKEGCPDLDYRLPATSWFKVENGKIAHQKDFIDWATFLELRQQMLAAGRDVDPGSQP